MYVVIAREVESGVGLDERHILCQLFEFMCPCHDLLQGSVHGRRRNETPFCCLSRGLMPPSLPERRYEHCADRCLMQSGEGSVAYMCFFIIVARACGLLMHLDVTWNLLLVPFVHCRIRSWRCNGSYMKLAGCWIIVAHPCWRCCLICV